MAAGDSLRKVAREKNQRPDALKSLVRSDEFLEILAGFDRDLADDIIAEREAAKPHAYEELILEEARKSVEKLANIRDYEENATAAVAASKALVDIAERIKKTVGEKSTKRITFPASQLLSFHETARELKEMEARVAESSPGEHRTSATNG